MLARFAAAAILITLPALAAPKWNISYFYDKDGSALTINDLAFPSATRGIAVGYIDEDDTTRPVSVTTDDAGQHWTINHLKQVPVSLFFLNAKQGWMVTPKGLWETQDAGRTWREIPKSPKSLMRILFLDENRGFAVGAEKQAYRTADGGKTWVAIAAAAEPHTNPEYSVYNTIVFGNGKSGFIAGYSAPPRKGNPRPDWLAGKAPPKEWPHLSIMLDTSDGGETWKSSTASMFGRITRATILPDGTGLGLIDFTDNFKWPSEVHRLDAETGKSTTVYNDADRLITDVLLTPSGAAYLAGVNVEGSLQHSPIPRRVAILKSKDLVNWEEMDVDYRAEAVRPILCGAPDGGMWAATDNGMILKLQ